MFYLLILVPIALQHIEIKGVHYETKNRFALTLFFVMLTALVMLRHESVGSDTRNYIYFFRKFASLQWGTLFNYSVEFGFALYNKIISVFTKDPQVFFAVTALVISAMIYPTYRRLCTDASLTIALFCIMSTFVTMFSGIRQMLAIGMGVLAYECVRNEKLIRFLLLVLLAITIHTSAFMLFLLYPVYHMRIKRKSLLVIVPSLMLIWVFNKPIFAALTAILENYTKYTGTISSTGAYTMLLVFTIFAVFCFVIPDETKVDDETIGLRNYLLLAIVIQMFAPLHMLAMRMNYYYIIFIPLLIPKVIAARKDSLRQVAVTGRWVMVVCLVLYFFAVLVPSGALRVFPYHFFWESGV